MINLLPVEEKGRIGKDYKHRVVFVYLMFIIAGLAVGLVLLLPSYFVINVVEGDLEKEVAILENSSESTKMEQINGEIGVTKERLRAITEEEEGVKLYEVIEKISTYKQVGIALTNFSYTKGSANRESRLLLGGNADTRDGLLSFTKDMEDDELFSEVVLPVSSLAKERDIEFSVEIKGNF